MVEQTVEIKYYNTDYLIEKVVDDNQIWIYESIFMTYLYYYSFYLFNCKALVYAG